MNASKQITKRKIPAALTKVEETLRYIRLIESCNTKSQLYIAKNLIDYSFKSGRVNASNHELLFNYIDNKISILQQEAGAMKYKSKTYKRTSSTTKVN